MEISHFLFFQPRIPPWISMPSMVSRSWLLALFVLVTTDAFAQAVVTVDRNTGAAATPAFKFTRVPSPVTDDAGAKAKLVLVDGDMDPNAGSFSAINDGLLPRDEDEPGANFFFDAGTGGGRFVMQFAAAIDIARVHTYSWHPNTRGAQVYTLYASDGVDPKFSAAPKHGIDPLTVGWKRVAAVDTRPPGGDTGGQYGVSITDPSGSLGKFQYLLFDCAATELQDDYGNTFYSEIDVIQRATAPSHDVALAGPGAGAEAAQGERHEVQAGVAAGNDVGQDAPGRRRVLETVSAEAGDQEETRQIGGGADDRIRVRRHFIQPRPRVGDGRVGQRR
jgi:hypothetical protein